MSDERVLRKKQLYEMFEEGNITPLDELYMVEDAALTVQELDKKIAFYKDYKKKKARDIDEEVRILESKRDFFKSVIISTLEDNNEKSLKVPGSCKIVTRKTPHKWTINDEDEFIRLVQEAEAEDKAEAVGVVEEVTRINIIKKLANKLLDTWEQNGTLEDLAKKVKKGDQMFVSKEPPGKTVSLTFEKEKEPEPEDPEIEVTTKKGEKAEINFDTV